MDDPTWRRALSELVPAGLDATVVFVRHGESTFITEGRFQGQADSPLTARGKRQAALVAARLAEPHVLPALPIPAGSPLEIAHSPLSRASETATSIGAAMARSGLLGDPPDAPLRADDGLAEIGQGDWEGLHRDEIGRRYGDILATWRRHPTEAWAPGGESLPDVAARLRPALTRLLDSLAAAGTPGTRDRDQVSGYGDPPAVHPWSVVVAHDGLFKIAFLSLFGLPLERFWMWSMDLCACTIIEFRAGQPVLRAHNLTAHLAPLLDHEATADGEARGRSGAL